MRVLDQLRSSRTPRDAGGSARREAMAWLRRFRAETSRPQGRAAVQGQSEKVQFISAVLHDPPVLLLDEPFTGLDPVNVMLLREAFLELRDRGRTVVFSRPDGGRRGLCESVAIVDRGRMVVGGRLRDVKRSTGRRMVRISAADDHRMAWLANVPGTRIIQAGMDRSSVELDNGVEPEAVLAAANGAGARVLHFESPIPARAGVHRPRRPPVDEGDPHLAPAEPGRAQRAGVSARGRTGRVEARAVDAA